MIQSITVLLHDFLSKCVPSAPQIQEFLVHRRVPLGFHAAWITEEQLLEFEHENPHPFFAGRYSLYLLWIILIDIYSHIYLYIYICVFLNVYRHLRYVYFLVYRYLQFTYRITYSFVYQAISHGSWECLYKGCGLEPLWLRFWLPNLEMVSWNLKGSWWFLIPFFRPYFLGRVALGGCTLRFPWLLWLPKRLSIGEGFSSSTAAAGWWDDRAWIFILQGNHESHSHRGCWFHFAK